jgi:hypothetical protein
MARVIGKFVIFHSLTVAFGGEFGQVKANSDGR